MEILIVILQLAGGVAGLHFGSNWLVSGSSRLALSFGIKPLIIGLTLVAFGTSAPELVVSIGSAVQGQSDIAVGNVVGSNIANIGLILGISALFKPIKVDRVMFKRDFPFMLGSALLLAVLPLIGGPVESGDGTGFLLTRWKGAILVGGLVLMLWVMFLSMRSDAPSPETMRDKAKRLRNIGLALIGLLLLLAGGKFFVDGAVTLAEWIGVPALVIGLTVVAVGTSLPELATSIVAMIKGEDSISIGNVVGSNIFNVFCVLGICALIHPTMVSAQVMRMDMIIMLGFTLAATLLAWHQATLGRVKGGMLLGAYGLYVANLFAGWV